MKGDGDQYHRTVRALRALLVPCFTIQQLGQRSVWVRLLAGVPRLQTHSPGELCPVTIGINQTARASVSRLVSRRLLQQEQLQKREDIFDLANRDFTVITACFRAEFLLILKQKVMSFYHSCNSETAGENTWKLRKLDKCLFLMGVFKNCVHRDVILQVYVIQYHHINIDIMILTFN